MVTRGQAGIASHRLCQAGVALAAVLLAACTAAPSGDVPLSGITAPTKQADTGMSPAVLHEHQRILATYGGVYNDPRLQSMIEQMVERLVAASEKPDLHYKVTILNSQSINAFALPTGQLYVTRGLIALADDDSELASVIAHEMGHVIAHHAELREKEEQQVELVSRVVNDVVSDPEAGALALAKSKLELASFSQKQEFEADAIGIGIAARAGYDPYGAARFLTALERNSELKPEQSNAINPAAPDFLSSHPVDPGAGHPGDCQCAPIQSRRPASARPSASNRETPISATSTASSMARIRAKALCAAGASCIRSSASPSPRRRVSPSTTPRRPFWASSTAAARRSGSTSCACPPSRRSPQYLTSGWIENIDPATVEDVTVNGFPGATAVAKGDQWDFRLYAIRFGSDVYRFIFAAKHRTPDTDRAFREVRRHLPPHESCRNRTGQAAAAENRESRARRYGGEAGERGWRLPTAPPTASACSTGSSRATG